MGANAKAKKAGVENELREPTDFGEGGYVEAQVLVTNACNLECSHCFVFREDNPNSPRDKMDDANMLHQLRLLRDKHGIKSMLFVGGEPMIRKDLVFEGMKLFDKCTIVTNGTYGIPSVPGHVVVVSLDGPEGPSDAIRGEGVFQKVKQAIFERDPADGTSVIMQMVLTRQNEEHLEAFVEEVKGWPISGLAFTFYVPNRDDRSSLVWRDLRERDRVVERLIALKRRYPPLDQEPCRGTRDDDVGCLHGRYRREWREVPIAQVAATLYGRKWPFRTHLLLLRQRRRLRALRRLYGFQPGLPFVPGQLGAFSNHRWHHLNGFHGRYLATPAGRP